LVLQENQEKLNFRVEDFHVNKAFMGLIKQQEKFTKQSAFMTLQVGTEENLFLDGFVGILTVFEV
jgi:hypothetical protein